MKSVYLDYAAATPLDPTVVAAMQPYFSDNFYNASATYEAARRVGRAVEASRNGVALLLGAKPAEVHFVAGVTLANQLVLEGIMRRFPGKGLLVSAIEHPSVLDWAAANGGQEIPVTRDGVVDLAELERRIDDDTVLVSVMYANNEIGTVQPVARIAALLAGLREKRRIAGNATPLYFHSDASQAANYLDLHVSRLGTDALVINGGKIYGPKQTAVLYLKSGINIALPGGTENVPGIVGIGAALDLAVAMRHEEVARLQQLQQRFITRVQAAIPSAVINGSLKKRLPNNVHITIPGQDNERLLMALDEAGIMAAAGSACTASDEEPSHVLTAIGLSDADAQASLRFTTGRGTTVAEIDYAVDTLAKLIV